MKSKRYYHIDVLKGISIIGIIIIHFLSFNLHSRFLSSLWNWLHFVVPAFVLASGYILLPRLSKKFKNPKETANWIIKRIWRLLAPFYLYLILHFSLINLFPFLFEGINFKNTISFLIKSALLLNGIDFNWFILLFFQLTLLTPIFALAFNRKFALKLLFLTSLVTTLYFYFKRPSYEPFKFTMIIPWSFVYLMGGLTYKIERKLKHKNLLYLFFAFIFFLLFFSFKPNLTKIVLTQHKYPPDLLYLSYGLSATYLLLIIAQLKFFQYGSVKKFLSYASKSSYNLFFSHYLALDLNFSLKKYFKVLDNIGLQLINVLILSFILLCLAERIFFELKKTVSAQKFNK